jgi:hypothetical protein
MKKMKCCECGPRSRIHNSSFSKYFMILSDKSHNYITLIWKACQWQTSRLIGLFVSYEENKVLWILSQEPYSQHLSFVVTSTQAGWGPLGGSTQVALTAFGRQANSSEELITVVKDLKYRPPWRQSHTFFANYQENYFWCLFTRNQSYFCHPGTKIMKSSKNSWKMADAIKHGHIFTGGKFMAFYNSKLWKLLKAENHTLPIKHWLTSGAIYSITIIHWLSIYTSMKHSLL